MSETTAEMLARAERIMRGMSAEEQFHTKIYPRGGRTLGAWRRKVLAPEVLLSTLLHDGRIDVLTRDTLAACAVLAEVVGDRMTAAALTACA